MQYKNNKAITPIFNKNGVCHVKSVLGKKIKILRIDLENISEQKYIELAGKFVSAPQNLYHP